MSRVPYTWKYSFDNNLLFWILYAMFTFGWQPAVRYSNAISQLFSEQQRTNDEFINEIEELFTRFNEIIFVLSTNTHERKKNSYGKWQVFHLRTSQSHAISISCWRNMRLYLWQFIWNILKVISIYNDVNRWINSQTQSLCVFAI